MSRKYRLFGILVISLVVLVGAGFGSLTGIIYSENYWWVAAIAATVSSYPLAIIYLMQLKKISSKKLSKKISWMLSTLVAVTCGVICTTFAHGIMTLIILHNSDIPLARQMDGFWPFIVMAGEITGAAAGLILGGISGYIYIFKLIDKRDETIKLL